MQVPIKKYFSGMPRQNCTMVLCMLMGMSRGNFCQIGVQKQATARSRWPKKG